MSAAVSLPTSLSVSHASSAYNDFNDFDHLLADIRIKKVAIIIFAVMASFGLACIIGSMAAWAIVPLSIGLTALLVVASLIILVAGILLITNPISRLSVLQEKLQKDIFHDLLISNDQNIRQKLELFKRYGHFCTELYLDSSLKIGMEIKGFLLWLLSREREYPILNSYVRNLLKQFKSNNGNSILTFDQLKRFYDCIQLMPAKHYGDKLSKKSYDGNVIRSLFHSPQQDDDDVSLNTPVLNTSLATHIPSEQILTSKELLQIIESCPNLKFIKSSFNLYAFNAVQKLCEQREISFEHIEGLDYFTSETFPGLVFR